MKRTSVALLGALEALIALAISLGVLVIPATLVWMIGTGFSGSWVGYWSAGADFWLLGNGVPLTVTLPDWILAPVGVVGANDPFGVALIPLALTILVIALGLRAGTRAADTTSWLSAFIGAIVVYAGGAAIVVATASGGAISFSPLLGIIMPPLVFGLAMLAAIGFRQYRYAEDIFSARLTDLIARIGDAPRAIAAAGLRTAGIATVALVGVSAVLFVILLLVNYPLVIALYENGGFGVGGGIVITLIQILFIPTLVVWLASWLIGPGFTLGTGALYGPLGTVSGPVPAVPVLGILPSGGASWGWVLLVIPLLIAVVAGLWLRRERVDQGLLSMREGWYSVAVAAVASGVGMGLLAWAASGAFGPGRLVDMGPTAWLVGLCFGAEVALGAAIGLFSGALRDAVDRS